MSLEPVTASGSGRRPRKTRRRYRMGNTIVAGVGLVVMTLVVFGLALGAVFDHTHALVRLLVAISTCLAGAFAVGRIVRLAAFGVLVDDRGVRVLNNATLFSSIIEIPWSRIERFSIARPVDVVAVGSSYSAQIVLHDGDPIRLTTITAAAVGTRPQHRVDAILAALNEQLEEHREGVSASSA